MIFLLRGGEYPQQSIDGFAYASQVREILDAPSIQRSLWHSETTFKMVLGSFRVLHQNNFVILVLNPLPGCPGINRLEVLFSGAAVSLKKKL